MGKKISWHHPEINPILEENILNQHEEDEDLSDLYEVVPEKLEIVAPSSEFLTRVRSRSRNLSLPNFSRRKQQLRKINRYGICKYLACSEMALRDTLLGV